MTTVYVPGGDGTFPDAPTTRQWVRQEQWHVRQTQTQKIVVMEHPPATGYFLRMSFRAPGGVVSLLSHTLEYTIGLPTRAKDALVTMACANLLEQGIGKRLTTRTSDDVEHNAQDIYQIKSYEVIQDVQFLRNSAMAKAQRVAMEPLTARCIP